MFKPIRRLTAFHMQVGESRGFCTQIKMEKGATKVSAPKIEEWLTEVTGFVFGGGLETRRKNLGYPNTLKVGQPLQAVLLLRWVRKVPLQKSHFACLEVQGFSEGMKVVEGNFTVIVPP